MNIAVGNVRVVHSGPNVRGGRSREQRGGNRNCFVAHFELQNSSGNLATMHVLITDAYRCKCRQDKKLCDFITDFSSSFSVGFYEI